MRGRDTSKYPIIVEGDGLKNERAFELFDNIVIALKEMGLSEEDAYSFGIVTYSPMAAVLRKRNGR